MLKTQDGYNNLHFGYCLKNRLFCHNFYPEIVLNLLMPITFDPKIFYTGRIVSLQSNEMNLI